MTTMYSVIKTSDVTDDQKSEASLTILPIARTDGKKGKSGFCIVVPQVSDSVLHLVTTSDIGKAWIVDCINDMRSKLASSINKAGQTITSDKLGIDALLAAMKAESESQRMTRDAIGAWFDSDISSIIAEKVKEKMPGIANDKLAKVLESYKENFQKLAGRDISMPNVVRDNLLRAMEFLPAGYDSVIGGKVLEKLASVTEAQEVMVAL